MRDVVILGGVRTAIGTFGGSLAGVTPGSSACPRKWAQVFRQGYARTIDGMRNLPAPPTRC